MSLTREQLISEALKLGADDREAMAEELLLSLTPADRDALDAAWLAEVRARSAAFDRGEIRAVAASEVFAELDARASK